MKKSMLWILFSLFLTGCKSNSDSIKEEASTPTIADEEERKETKKTEETVPSFVKVYYFQIDVKNINGKNERINSDLSYKFSLSYPYGTKLDKETLPEAICLDFSPIAQRQNRATSFYTSLDPLSLQSSIFDSLTRDIVVYFGNYTKPSLTL